MGNEIVETPSNGKKPPRSTQSLDIELSKWIERQFRGGETPQAIDAYPLYKGKDREQRLYHYHVKVDENVTAERAVELANDIFSDCQLHCDSLPRTALSRERSKTYEVSVVDDRRGGLAHPVGTHFLKLFPRIHAPAPTEDDGDDDALSAEDSELTISKKMMIEAYKETAGRAERNQAAVLSVAGDMMLLQKDHIRESFDMIREMHRDGREMMREFRELIREEGRRRVEEKAVAIDEANAEMERDVRRAQLNKENMWTNVMQAGMLEGVKVLGALFPGFGQLFSALIQGKPVPPPPQLPAAGGTNGAAPSVTSVPSQPQLPAVPPEKALIDRFIEAAEKHKVDENFTAAEKLFGKDSDQGKPIEAGVFTREQVAILTGVHMGSLGVETLDALLPGSGKPEEIQGLQMAKAMAYLTPEMISDISKVLDIRKAAKK